MCRVLPVSYCAGFFSSKLETSRSLLKSSLDISVIGEKAASRLIGLGRLCYFGCLASGEETTEKPNTCQSLKPW